MWFDLQTLLALRFGIDLLIAGAFWGMHRRLPAMGGPRWWAGASLVHIAASIGLLLREHVPPVLILPVSNLLYTATFACVWIGFRRYAGLPVRLLRYSAVGALCVVGYVVMVAVHDTVLGRQLLWTASCSLVLGLFLRDALRMQPRPQAHEHRWLQWVLIAELAGMAGYAVTFLGLGWSLGESVPLLVFYFMLTSLVRALACNALVVQRLRQEGDRAQTRAQQREADLRHLVDNLSAGVMVFRANHTLCAMNAAARQFLGWSEGGANAALPQPMPSNWQMVHEDGSVMRRHDMPFERVLATGLAVHNVVVGVPVGERGELRWALCNAYPENDAIGGLRRVVLTFIDITSLKLAQAQQKALQGRLSQAQKMQALGTLAGGVAHDFNNILAAILGNADLARQDLAPRAPALESLAEISTAARRGRELVRQILAFSRQQPLAREPLQLGEVVDEAAALLRAALPSHAQLVLRCDAQLPRMCGDATQLAQVVLNLGTNALHALPAADGCIEFVLDTVAPNDPGLPLDWMHVHIATGARPVLRLRVIDNGNGMEESVQRRIFEPFFTTKPVGKGTGLGLSVVLGIVEAHGGVIDVCSTPGRGTTMTLYFESQGEEGAGETDVTERPRANGESRQNAPTIRLSRNDREVTSPMNADAQAPHVLYLDDDDTLVFLVRRLLERRGYRVSGYTQQADAIAAVRDQPGTFSLLLTDFNMPGMSGLEVAREVLAIDAQLPVAVASGYITDELQAEARAAGVREVVFKTDAVESFCEVVARLVQPAA